MTPDEKQRLGTAVGFLSGVLACLEAVREADVRWPLDALWAGMHPAHRLLFVGGLALIVVTLVLTVIRRRR